MPKSIYSDQFNRKKAKNQPVIVKPTALVQQTGLARHHARDLGLNHGAHPAVRLAGLALALVPGAGLALHAAPAQAQAEAQAEPQPGAPVDPFEIAPAGPLMRNDVAGARRIPGYAPVGLDFGALHLDPSLTLAGQATTNAFARAAGRARGDSWATLTPALSATGTAGPARYGVEASATFARHAHLPGLDSETGSLALKAGIPLTGRLALGLSGALARRLEPPFSAAGASATDGSAVLVDKLQAGLSARADLGLTRLTAGLELARAHYLPIVPASGLAPVPQGFRDDRVIAAALRVERSLGGGKVLFAQGAYRRVRALHPGIAPDRTARAGEALVGLRGEFSHLVMGELAAGFQWRSYRSPALRDWRGAAWRARVEWYATPLVTLTLAARRDFANSPLPAAAGVSVDTFSLAAHYELRRNLNLTLSAARAVERYRDLAGATPTVRSTSAGLEADYATSRHLRIGLTARYRDRRSASPLLPRQGHAVEGGMSLRFAL